MAYSAWKWEKQMSLKEKKTAWTVLEAFPSFKQKMKLKEKFSIRLIRKTYKWLIKVDEALKKTGKVTISDFMVYGPEGCSIFLEDAFEISAPDESFHAETESKDGRESAVDDALYDSDSSYPSDDDDIDDEKLQEMLFNLEAKTKNANPGRARARQKRKGTELGQMMGGMLGGMMQGLVGGLVGKDNIVYKIHKEKYEKLEEYVKKDYKFFTEKEGKDHQERLKLMRDILTSYDTYEDNPIAQTSYASAISKKLEAIETPYPAAAGFDEEKYSSEVISSVTDGQGDGCIVM